MKINIFLISCLFLLLSCKQKPEKSRIDNKTNIDTKLVAELSEMIELDQYMSADFYGKFSKDKTINKKIFQ